MDKLKRFEELFEDEAFVKEFIKQESAADAQALLEKNGVEMTTEEIESIADVVRRYAEGEITEEQLEKAANGELSEEELEEVAGGVIVMGTVAFVSIIIGSCAAGGITAGVLCTIFRRW